MIAIRDDQAALIDAKQSMRDTGRYTISCLCIDAGLRLAGPGLPIYYIFGNLGVLTASEIQSYQFIATLVPDRGYYLIDTAMTRRFDDIFGPPATMRSA